MRVFIVYNIGNSSDRAVSATITLRGEFESLELWDPATGERQIVETTVKDGTTTLALSLPKISSFFLVEGTE